MQTGELTYGADPHVVAELVSMAWSTFVGSELAPIEDVVPTENVMCSSISIHGPWSGHVAALLRPHGRVGDPLWCSAWIRPRSSRPTSATSWASWRTSSAAT